MVLSYVNSWVFWCSGFYRHWSDYTAAEASGLLQLWQQHDSTLIKLDMLKVYRYAQGFADFAAHPAAPKLPCPVTHHSSPLPRRMLWFVVCASHPAQAEEICCCTGTANTLPAVWGSLFLEQEEPPKIISEQGLALDSSSQLCQQEMGQLDRKRLKFRVVPHLLLLLMLKTQWGFLEVVTGQTCLLHLSHSL